MTAQTPAGFIALHGPDWETFLRARYELVQSRISAKDWDGLSTFFAEVLRLSYPDHWAERVLAIWPEGFAAQLEETMRAAIDAAVAQECRGLYFEWEGSGPAMNFFICPRYDKNDGDWAADFTDCLDGPSPECIDVSWAYGEDGLETEFVRDYIDAYLMSCLGAAWQQLGPASLTFGAAEHDFSIYEFGPGKAA